MYGPTVIASVWKNHSYCQRMLIHKMRLAYRYLSVLLPASEEVFMSGFAMNLSFIQELPYLGCLTVRLERGAFRNRYKLPSHAVLFLLQGKKASLGIREGVMASPHITNFWHPFISWLWGLFSRWWYIYGAAVTITHALLRSHLQFYRNKSKIQTSITQKPLTYSKVSDQSFKSKLKSIFFCNLLKQTSIPTSCSNWPGVHR